MKEVFGYGTIEKEFERLKIRFKRTHSGDKGWSIYELSDGMYRRLDRDPLGNHATHWGECGAAWQWNSGSNLGPVSRRYCINGKYFKGWANQDHREFPRYLPPMRWKSIREYLENVTGATTDRNVAACVADLAKQNGLKISEFLDKHGGI